MADTDTSTAALNVIISLPLPTPNLSRLIWQPVTDGNLAMRLAPLSWQPSGAHYALEYLASERDAAIARAEQAEAREQTLIEGAETNRKTLLRHNADHAAQVAALRARVAELEGAIRAQAEAITDQVHVTRAYAADSDMGKNNVLLIEINTSHFLDYANELRVALAGEGGE